MRAHTQHHRTATDTMLTSHSHTSITPRPPSVTTHTVSVRDEQTPTEVPTAAAPKRTKMPQRPTHSERAACLTHQVCWWCACAANQKARVCVWCDMPPTRNTPHMNTYPCPRLFPKAQGQRYRALFVSKMREVVESEQCSPPLPYTQTNLLQLQL